MSAAERTDNTSLVPQFRFPETLAEQEAALTTNSLMQRLLAYRERYEGDPHRPNYHYVNPENTLNDPNGLCFWQDRWHLFYQAYPPEDPRQHWGHAVSDDLIHWRDLPYAIYPNPEECCYSGATLVEEDRVIAIYHGTKVGNMVAVRTIRCCSTGRNSPARQSSPLPVKTARPCPTVSSIPVSGKKATTTTPCPAARCPTLPPANAHAPTSCFAHPTWSIGNICTRL